MQEHSRTDEVDFSELEVQEQKERERFSSGPLGKNQTR